MNRKGVITFETIMWVFRLMFLIAVILIAVLFVNAFVKTNFNIQEIESYVLVNRFIYSPTNLAYDEKGLERIYPGRIDTDKLFTIDDAHADFGNVNIIAASIRIGDQEIYAKYNDKWYDKWKVIADAGIWRGPSGITRVKESRAMIIVDNGGEEYEPVEFDVLTPNS